MPEEAKYNLRSQEAMQSMIYQSKIFYGISNYY